MLTNQLTTRTRSCIPPTWPRHLLPASLPQFPTHINIAHRDHAWKAPLHNINVNLIIHSSEYYQVRHLKFEKYQT